MESKNGGAGIGSVLGAGQVENNVLRLRLAA